MSGKYLIKIIQKAKEVGYQIDIFYLYLADVKDHIARVQNRVFTADILSQKRTLFAGITEAASFFLISIKNLPIDGFCFLMPMMNLKKLQILQMGN
jgi:hypothetical protein